MPEVLSKRQVDSSTVQPANDIAEIRNRLVNVCLVVGSLLGLPVQVIDFVLPVWTGDGLHFRREALGYLVVVAVTLARHRIPYGVRAGFAIGIVFLTGALQLFEFGLVSFGGSMLLVSAVLAALLLGRRAAIVVTMFSAALLLFAGWAVNTGAHTIQVETAQLGTSISMHVAQATGLVFFGLVLAILFGAIEKTLLGSIETLMQRTHYVEAANAKLLLEIEERRQTEDALRESKALFQVMFDAAPVGMAAVRDMRLLFANPECARMLGFDDSEELAGLDAISMLPTEFQSLAHTRLNGILQGQSNDAIEAQFTRRDGTQGWAMSKSVPIRLNGKLTALVVCQDITQGKIAAADRERLLAAIEQSGESIVITSADSYFEYVNPAFQRVTGYTRDEILGMHTRLLKSGLHTKSFYEDMWQTITSGRTWQGRFQNRRKDGTIYTAESTISPAMDSKGQIVNFVEVSRDITAELKHEELFRQAQKLEAVGRLTGGIAHDFNNLLQVINLSTEIAGHALDAEHPAQTWLATTLQAGDRAAGLVAQLLAFSRRQTLQPVAADMNNIIAELLSLIRPLLGEQVELCWLPEEQLWPVLGDPSLIEQIVMNLCVNARDAMHDGGRITIETKRVTVSRDFCSAYTWATPGEYVLLRVSDTGIGMSPETLEHIFEPFFTTKEEGRGTGLGLAMVYGITKQHKGFVNAYSEVGQGSAFSVYLPRAAEVLPQPSAPATRIEASGGRETILIAEDNAMVRDLAKHLLERAGYTVMAASDGQEALGIFEANSEKIDLVVLDVVMPVMGGREAFERMRAFRPSVRVLFASGYSENAIHTNFVLNEGLTLVPKPYSNDALLRGVRSVLDA